MSGTSRFDCFPSDFLNGIIGLTSDEIAVYTVIMMLQYDRGKPVMYCGREREIAIRAGRMSTGRLAKAVARLEEIGKLELVDGCLSNQRTVDELAKISEKIAKNRENSLKGGESTRQIWNGKGSENKSDVEPIGQPTGPVTASPNLLPSSPVHSSQSSTETRARSSSFDEDFETWWVEYPSKVGKDAAKRSYLKVRRERRATQAELLRGIEVYRATKPPDRDWCNPTTYLNQGRWKDDPGDGVLLPFRAKAPPETEWDRVLRLDREKSDDLQRVQH